MIGTGGVRKAAFSSLSCTLRQADACPRQDHNVEAVTLSSMCLDPRINNDPLLENGCQTRGGGEGCGEISQVIFYQCRQRCCWTAKKLVVVCLVGD